MTDTVLAAHDAGILTLKLNRPDALNAFHPEMLEAIAAELAGLDERTGVVVIEGAGRAFSAGVDLKVLQGIAPHAGRVGDVFDAPAAAAARAIRAAPVPVIAKVHGFCFTGALEIALHCDFMYTTRDTKFGDTHAKFGLRPTWGMTQTLAQAVGVRRAKELSFTARTFTGADAERWDLAVEAVDDTAALDALVGERAAAIAANSRAAVSAIKSLYALAQERMPIDQALAAELAADFPDIGDTSERLAGFGG